MLNIVINLDRSPERLEKTKKEFDKWGLTFERLAATDGRLMTQDEVDARKQPYAERRYFLKELTRGEIGCFMSHYRAWEKLLESDQDWAFICEDDLVFFSDPRYYLGSTDWIPQGVRLIQLARPSIENVKVKRRKYVHTLSNGARLMVLHQGINGGCIGYMMHREAAQKFVAIAKTHIPAPSDDLLFSFASPLRREVTPWSLSPAVVGTDDNGISDVGGEKGKVKTRFWQGPAQYIERKWINLKNKWIVYSSCEEDYR